MNIAQAILHLHPGKDPINDFMVMDQGDGPFLAEWNIDAPKPTDEELQAAWEAIQAQPEESKPLPTVEELQQQLEEQKTKNQELEQQTAQVNTDLVAFMEFYFSQP